MNKVDTTWQNLATITDKIVSRGSIFRFPAKCPYEDIVAHGAAGRAAFGNNDFRRGPVNVAVMSIGELLNLNKFVSISLCILSVVLVFLAGNPELGFTNLEHPMYQAYLFVFLLFIAIYFLQNQVYTYLVPKNVRINISNIEGTYDNKSFFKGSVSTGYFLVMFHVIGYFIEGTNHPVFLYLGIILIFCGTLSKVKSLIANELNGKNDEDS